MPSLLDLPQEIRNQIWTCVLFADESEASFWGPHECKICRWISLRRGFKVEVAVLLLVSKQVCTDIRNLPVQHAVSIGFRHPGCFQRWIRRASMHDMLNVRRVVLKYERETFIVNHRQWGAGRIREEILASLQKRFAAVNIQDFDYTTLRYQEMRSHYSYHWSRTNPAIEDYALRAEILVSQPRPPVTSKTRSQPTNQGLSRLDARNTMPFRRGSLTPSAQSGSLPHSVISTIVPGIILRPRTLSWCMLVIGINVALFAAGARNWLWT